MINLSTSLEGSFTLIKDEEQTLDGWEERLIQDGPRSTPGTSSRSSTVTADDSESDRGGCVAKQPPAEVGM